MNKREGRPRREPGKNAGAGSAAPALAPNRVPPRPGGESHLAALLDSMGAGYFEADLEARFTVASETLSRLLGRSGEELLGKSVCNLDLALPGQGAELRRMFDRALLTGSDPQPLICGIVHADGRVRQMEISATLAHGEGGQHEGFRGLFRDVTDRERAQAMVRATLDSQQTQICILDERGVIRVVNRVWDFDGGTCGPGAGFAIGGSYLTVLESHRQSGNSTAAVEVEGIQAVLENRRKDFTLEYARPDPIKPRWYNLTATPLLISGKPSGAVLSRRDVTERKLAEEELTRLYKAMDASIDGLALFDAGGGSLFMNPAFAHLFGYDAPVELAGKGLRDLLPPGDLLRLDSEIIPRLRRLGYWLGELGGLPRDGGTVHLEVALTLIDKGQVTIFSARDVSDRKRVENALKESEFKFRSIFDTVQEAIIAVDVAGGMKIVAANGACLEMFGYPPGTPLEDLDVSRHLREEDAEEIAGHFRSMLVDRPHARTRYRVLRGDGSGFWVEAQGSNTEFGGRPVALVALSDITAGVEAEAALRRSEVLLRSVIESARDVIFIKGKDRKYLTMNPAGAALFGMTPDRIVGLRDEDLFDPAGAAAAALSDSKVLAGSTVEEETVKTPARYGARTFHAHKVPLRDEAGNIFGICGIVRDTTERKQSEAVIRDSEEKMRLLVEGARDFFFYIADRDLNYTYISPGNFETITGFTPEEIRGEHAPLPTDNPVNAAANEWTRRVLEEGVHPPPYLFEIRHKDGRPIMLETYERPILKEGRVVGLQGIAHDVTERERTQAELRRKDKLLEAVADAARVMMGAPDSPGAIGAALAILGRAAEVDRVYLYEIHGGGEQGGEVLSQRYEWTSDRVRPQISNPQYQSIPLSHPLAQQWRPILEKGGCVRQVVRNLPEAEQAIFQANGGRSLLVVPVFRGGRLWGCLGFNDCTTEREWTRSDEAILSAFATCVSGTLPEG